MWRPSAALVEILTSWEEEYGKLAGCIVKCSPSLLSALLKARMFFVYIYIALCSVTAGVNMWFGIQAISKEMWCLQVISSIWACLTCKQPCSSVFVPGVCLSLHQAWFSLSVFPMHQLETASFAPATNTVHTISCSWQSPVPDSPLVLHQHITPGPFWHCDSMSEMPPSSLLSICLLGKSTRASLLADRPGLHRGELLP